MVHENFKQYWKEVEQNLTCSRSARKKFYQQTLEAANRFLDEQPDLTFDQVEEYLGSPQELAQNYLDTLSPEETATFQKKQKLIMAALAVIFILAVVIAAALFFERGQLPTVYVDTVVIDEGEISIPTSPSTEE